MKMFRRVRTVAGTVHGLSKLNRKRQLEGRDIVRLLKAK